MPKLVWDKTGERRYETGVDRGVLYLPDGLGVPWNGLTGVEEDHSSVETTAYHFDGVKYLDTRAPGDYSGTLRAYTYPDEFLQFDGFSELNKGVLLGHQPTYERFGLSYRTKIGNDVEGIEHGYKIHILYNLVAVPENRIYTVLTDQQNPSEFSWKITGVPEPLPGHRPTAHVILDTTRLNPFLVLDLETLLYGKDAVQVPVLDVLDGGNSFPSTAWERVDGGSSNVSSSLQIDGGSSLPPTDSTFVTEDISATLPPLSDLVKLIEEWLLIEITDNGNGTWTATGPDEVVAFLDSSTFQISSGSAQYLDEDTYEISTTHSF